jgi:hypothetical protein
MVDLQRSIGRNEGPFAAGCKTSRENSDAGGQTAVGGSLKFSAGDSGENIIRCNLTWIGRFHQ